MPAEPAVPAADPPIKPGDEGAGAGDAAVTGTSGSRHSSRSRGSRSSRRSRSSAGGGRDAPISQAEDSAAGVVEHEGPGRVRSTGMFGGEKWHASWISLQGDCVYVYPAAASGTGAASGKKAHHIVYLRGASLSLHAEHDTMVLIEAADRETTTIDVQSQTNAQAWLAALQTVVDRLPRVAPAADWGAWLANFGAPQTDPAASSTAGSTAASRAGSSKSKASSGRLHVDDGASPGAHPANVDAAQRERGGSARDKASQSAGTRVGARRAKSKGKSNPAMPPPVNKGGKDEAEIDYSGDNAPPLHFPSVLEHPPPQQQQQPQPQAESAAVAGDAAAAAAALAAKRASLDRKRSLITSAVVEAAAEKERALEEQRRAHHARYSYADPPIPGSGTASKRSSMMSATSTASETSNQALPAPLQSGTSSQPSIIVSKPDEGMFKVGEMPGEASLLAMSYVRPGWADFNPDDQEDPFDFEPDVAERTRSLSGESYSADEESANDDDDDEDDVVWIRAEIGGVRTVSPARGRPLPEHLLASGLDAAEPVSPIAQAAAANVAVSTAATAERRASTLRKADTQAKVTRIDEDDDDNDGHTPRAGGSGLQIIEDVREPALAPPSGLAKRPETPPRVHRMDSSSTLGQSSGASKRPKLPPAPSAAPPTVPPRQRPVPTPAVPSDEDLKSDSSAAMSSSSDDDDFDGIVLPKLPQRPSIYSVNRQYYSTLTGRDKKEREAAAAADASGKGKGKGKDKVEKPRSTSRGRTRARSRGKTRPQSRPKTRPGRRVSSVDASSPAAEVVPAPASPAADVVPASGVPVASTEEKRKRRGSMLDVAALNALPLPPTTEPRDPAAAPRQPSKQAATPQGELVRERPAKRRSSAAADERVPFDRPSSRQRSRGDLLLDLATLPAVPASSATPSVASENTAATRSLSENTATTRSSSQAAAAAAAPALDFSAAEAVDGIELVAASQPMAAVAEEREHELNETEAVLNSPPPATLPSTTLRLPPPVPEETKHALPTAQAATVEDDAADEAQRRLIEAEADAEAAEAARQLSAAEAAAQFPEPSVDEHGHRIKRSKSKRRLRVERPVVLYGAPLDRAAPPALPQGFYFAFGFPRYRRLLGRPYNRETWHLATRFQYGMAPEPHIRAIDTPVWYFGGDKAMRTPPRYVQQPRS